MIHSIENKEQLDKVINDKDEKVYTYFYMPHYSLSDISLYLSYIKTWKETFKDFAFKICSYEINFNDDDFRFFFALEAALKPLDISLRFFENDFYFDYSLEELLKTDKYLDNLIDEVNKASLSPFERFLYIYDYLTDKKYNLSDNALERDLIGVTNSDYIVCQGYSELLAYLLKYVGIFSFNQICLIAQKDGGFEKHQNNLVYIDDEKYDIHGLYYADATWDSGAKTLLYSLLPLSDVTQLIARVELEEAFPIFYNYKSALSDALDRWRQDIVGGDICIEDTFVYEYIPSNLERIIPISEEIKASHDLAIKLIKKKREWASDTFLKILDECHASDDLFSGYGRTYCGTTFTYLFCSLLWKETNEAFVKRIVEFLIKNKPNMDFSDDPLKVLYPCLEAPDVRVLLNKIKTLDEKEFDMPREKWCEKIFNLRKEHFDTIEGYERYDLLIAFDELITRFRAWIVYREAKDYINENYPEGKPLDIPTYRKGLEVVYKVKGKDLSLIEKSIEDSIYFSPANFYSEATNCFIEERKKRKSHT